MTALQPWPPAQLPSDVVYVSPDDTPEAGQYGQFTGDGSEVVPVDSPGVPITVNDGPVATGLLPLAVPQQPVCPPSGIIQPRPPLNGFVFPNAPKTFTFATAPADGAVAGICVGRDGNVYVADFSPNQIIWQLTPAGVATAFPVSNQPYAICSGPDGNLWYTAPYAAPDNGVSRVTLAGVETFFPLAGSSLEDICSGPDGNLWACDDNASVWRITPAGVGTQIALGDGADALQICAGPDGNIWATDVVNTTIWRVTPDGVATQFPLGLGAYVDSGSICAGPDGNLWAVFTANLDDAPGGYVAKVTPSGEVLALVNLPGPPVPLKMTICAGAGGDLWVTSGNRDADAAFLWKVTVEGVATAFAWPDGTDAQNLMWICSGPDGGLWLTNSQQSVTVFPFYVQLGNIIGTAIPAADPHIAGAVYSGAAGALFVSAG